MAAKKEKLATHKTPKGTAIYPWLTKPDTKYNADGEYRIKLRLSEKAAAPIIEMIDEAIAKKMPEALEEVQGNAKMAEAYRKAGKLVETKAAKGKTATITGIVESTPYAKVFNDQNQETGEVDLTFKMKALVKPKNGDPFTQKPKLFDASGKPIVGRVAIHGGSEVQVAFQMVPFSTSIAGCGVSLRLQAVAVFKLVSSGGRAEDYGFDTEEGGYEAEDAPADDDAPETKAKAKPSGEDESADF